MYLSDKMQRNDGCKYATSEPTMAVCQTQPNVLTAPSARERQCSESFMKLALVKLMVTGCVYEAQRFPYHMSVNNAFHNEKRVCSTTEDSGPM